MPPKKFPGKGRKSGYASAPPVPKRDYPEKPKPKPPKRKESLRPPAQRRAGQRSGNPVPTSPWDLATSQQPHQVRDAIRSMHRQEYHHERDMRNNLMFGPRGEMHRHEIVQRAVTRPPLHRPTDPRRFVRNNIRQQFMGGGIVHGTEKRYLDPRR